MMPARWNGLDWIVRVLVTLVPLASVSAVVLLLCGAFTPQRALLIGGLFALLTAPRLAVPGIERWPAQGRAALGVLLVLALLVRWPPALYLQGGQDQGVYVTMAAHFADTRGLDIVDELRARLHDSEKAQRYDDNNTGHGGFQPGVYTNPSAPGRYIFQFYPVHPLWMTIFGGLFGMEQAAVSQIFFALVSLLFGALLAERLTADWRAGIAYAGILAVLPLHVFFSKFPISEMPTLAFAMMGWFALSCYHETMQERPRPLWLVVAGVCFLALFCTRISGFTYLPVVFAGALLTHAFVEDPHLRRQWALFWLFVGAAYVLSVAYGLTYSYPYAHDIYVMGFGERIYARLRWLLPLGLLVVAAPFLLTLAPQKRRRLRDVLGSACSHAQQWTLIFFVLIVALGLVRVGLLAFTDHYQGNPWYDVRWHASHGGEDAWRRSSLYVAAAHLSPFLAALVPFSLWRPGRSAPRMLLVTMVLAMVAYTAVIQWFVPYQYYYARYQLSELIPYALLIVVVRAHDGWRLPRIRAALIAALALSGAYFAWYAWPLLGFRESEGTHDSLKRIADRMDSNDVLLFDQYASPIPHELVTPLRFFFHKLVYTFSDRSQLPDIASDLAESGFGDLYLMSSREAPAPDGFELVDEVTLEQTTMAHSIGIPRQPVSSTQSFAFYRFDRDAFNTGLLQSTGGLHLGVMRPSCCRGIYPDNSWTDGNAVVRDVSLPAGQWHELLVSVHGYRTDYDQADLKIIVNGRQLPAKGFQDDVFTFDLGTVEGPAKMNIGISSNTFVPKQRGINDDPRELGIDIDALRVR